MMMERRRLTKNDLDFRLAKKPGNVNLYDIILWADPGKDGQRGSLNR